MACPRDEFLVSSGAAPPSFSKIVFENQNAARLLRALRSNVAQVCGGATIRTAPSCPIGRHPSEAAVLQADHPAVRTRPGQLLRTNTGSTPAESTRQDAGQRSRISGRPHVVIYGAIAGLALWFVLSAWMFFGSATPYGADTRHYVRALHDGDRRSLCAVARR
jgi:hypothetical protein